MLSKHISKNLITKVGKISIKYKLSSSKLSIQDLVKEVKLIVNVITAKTGTL